MQGLCIQQCCISVDLNSDQFKSLPSKIKDIITEYMKDISNIINTRSKYILYVKNDDYQTPYEIMLKEFKSMGSDLSYDRTWLLYNQYNRNHEKMMKSLKS